MISFPCPLCGTVLTIRGIIQRKNTPRRRLARHLYNHAELSDRERSLLADAVQVVPEGA